MLSADAVSRAGHPDRDGPGIREVGYERVSFQRTFFQGIAAADPSKNSIGSDVQAPAVPLCRENALAPLECMQYLECIMIKSLVSTFPGFLNAVCWQCGLLRRLDGFADTSPGIG